LLYNLSTSLSPHFPHLSNLHLFKTYASYSSFPCIYRFSFSFFSYLNLNPFLYARLALVAACYLLDT
jgi:hypothetical protein